MVYYTRLSSGEKSGINDIIMAISHKYLFEENMKKVTILGLYNSMATTIFGPMDILNQAGRLWPRVNKSPQTPFFDVAIASADGPIQCLNKVQIQPHDGIEAIQQTDLLIIASATYIDEILQKNPGLVPWIRGNTTRAPMWPASAPECFCWPKPDCWTENRLPCTGGSPRRSAGDIPGSLWSTTGCSSTTAASIVRPG